jgi:ABC-type branched-subunit amino acid transport system ATPase component
MVSIARALALEPKLLLLEEMEMKAQATKLQGAENDLKQLMADVTRAAERAQEAVARIASKAAPVITETESTSR